MAALSQLSYSPFECEVICKGNTRALGVAGRSQPQVLLMLAGDEGNRKQEASIQLSAVHAEQVDLLLAVGGAHIACRGEADRAGMDDDHALVVVEAAPLALDPPDPLADVEGEITPGVLLWTKDGHTCPHGREFDLQFGDQSFVVPGEHEQMFA